ncbi:unnamed protein product [Urochloa humidicola]
MAVLPSHCVDEEELTSLKSLVETQSEAADDAIVMEEDFKALLRKTTELEGAEARAHSPSDELAWAESLESDVRETAEAIADEAEALRHGAAVLALRPGEEATVAALRGRAALLDAQGAEAEEVAGAARRLQEKNLRTIAAREERYHDDLSWLIECVADKVGPSLRKAPASPRRRSWMTWSARAPGRRRGWPSWPAASGAARRRSRRGLAAMRLSWARCGGRPPMRMRRARRSSSSPRPCAGYGTEDRQDV